MKPPSPFCFNLKGIKAIVLGTDPSNFTDKGKTKILTKAFGIGDGDSGYFRNILNNLKQIGLGLEDIYVDNLIQNYLNLETSKNKNWIKIAKENIPDCLSILDRIDKKRKIPVLITAEVIYKVLLNDDVRPTTAEELYTGNFAIPIIPKENKLLRPIIPFYRHYEYSLDKHDSYRNKIKSLFDKFHDQKQ